jgi:hypothetical protein
MLACVAAKAEDDPRVLTLAAAADRMSGDWSLRADPWALEHAEAAMREARSRLGAQKSQEA